jgi:hypothetical protein
MNSQEVNVQATKLPGHKRRFRHRRRGNYSK